MVWSFFSILLCHIYSLTSWHSFIYPLILLGYLGGSNSSDIGGGAAANRSKHFTTLAYSADGSCILAGTYVCTLIRTHVYVHVYVHVEYTLSSCLAGVSIIVSGWAIIRILLLHLVLHLQLLLSIVNLLTFLTLSITFESLSSTYCIVLCSHAYIGGLSKYACIYSVGSGALVKKFQLSHNRWAKHWKGMRSLEFIHSTFSSPFSHSSSHSSSPFIYPLYWPTLPLTPPLALRLTLTQDPLRE